MNGESRRETRRAVTEGVACLRAFRWVSTHDLPPRHDLRRRGWLRVPADASTDGALAIAACGAFDAMAWVRFLIVHAPARRRRFILLDIDDSHERARLLRLGFADVLGRGIGIDELEARAVRVAVSTDMLPRYRDIGALRLDFLARDGFAESRALGLHPREFALLWRLSDEPGRAVAKATLVRDVWRQRFLPETNSLAVHISRLRDKLRLAGLPPLVGTASAGGYVLLATVAEASPPSPPAIPLRAGRPDAVGRPEAAGRGTLGAALPPGYPALSKDSRHEA